MIEVHELVVPSFFVRLGGLSGSVVDYVNYRLKILRYLVKNLD
jgi:hypothetical protein